jgi:hypothetical protein
VGHVRAYPSPQGQAEQMGNRRREYTAVNLSVKVIFISVWGSADNDVWLLDG